MSIAVDPAKRDTEWTRIERDMLDFRSGVKRSSQLTARIDGIDRDFLFGNARFLYSRVGGEGTPTCAGWDSSPK